MRLTIFYEWSKACVSGGCMNTFCERFLKLSLHTIQYLPRLLQYGDVSELFVSIAQRSTQLQLGEGDNLITPSDQ